jgi:hypothetical protein
MSDVGGVEARIDGVAILDPNRPAAGIPPLRWRQFIRDCEEFLDPAKCLAERAFQMGWYTLDLFGCHPSQPLAYLGIRHGRAGVPARSQRAPYASGGSLSDMVNLARARDAAAEIVLRDLNTQGSRSGAPPVRDLQKPVVGWPLARRRAHGARSGAFRASGDAA